MDACRNEGELGEGLAFEFKECSSGAGKRAREGGWSCWLVGWLVGWKGRVAACSSAPKRDEPGAVGRTNPSLRRVTHEHISTLVLVSCFCRIVTERCLPETDDDDMSTTNPGPLNRCVFRKVPRMQFTLSIIDDDNYLPT